MLLWGYPRHTPLIRSNSDPYDLLKRIDPIITDFLGKNHTITEWYNFLDIKITKDNSKKQATKMKMQIMDIQETTQQISARRRQYLIFIHDCRAGSV